MHEPKLLDLKLYEMRANIHYLHLAESDQYICVLYYSLLPLNISIFYSFSLEIKLIYWWLDMVNWKKKIDHVAEMGKNLYSLRNCLQQNCCDCIYLIIHIRDKGLSFKTIPYWEHSAQHH